MSRAFRDGWDRVFGPKPEPALRNPFPLRRGVMMHYEIPADFNLADLRRLTQHLATMCHDWGPEMGFPDVVFPPEKP